MKSLNDCDAHLSWTDFNDAEDQGVITPRLNRRSDKQEVEEALHRKIDQALFYLFPNGETTRRTTRRQFLMGDIHGSEGESLKVELEGDKIGQWYDFATGEGGDIFKLWGLVKGWDDRTRFPEIINDMKKWLGMPSSDKPRPKEKKKQEDLGSPTGKWNYHDEERKLIACVYRYDLPRGKKEFRPFDVTTQRYVAPDPRPLYNLPGIAQSDSVILVEGEKCAEALIQQGFCATTAMGGANTPLEKTDWAPLKGKHVLIWPDNDAPGREYGDKLVSWLHRQPVLSLSRVSLPEDIPEKWDAADGVAEGRDIEVFLKHHARMVSAQEYSQETTTAISSTASIRAFSMKEWDAEPGPMPEDLIAPRLLTPGGLLVLGGAPKVGKTDFLLGWLAHMSAGLPFLSMQPTRPLKIFYLQVEIPYYYMWERTQQINIHPSYRPLVQENLVITDSLMMRLDEEGVPRLIQTIRQFFIPDVIVIDPLRNVFDGKSENDNMEMMMFLQDRIEVLRRQVNPLAGIMLVHHTRKMSKKEVGEDPFQALSGASCLRSFYSTGMLLYSTDEEKTLRRLAFELRCGKSIATKYVDKVDGQWQEMDVSHARTIRKDFGEKCDQERKRVTDVIVTLIAEAAKRGEVYTPTQFSHVFENKAGLGGEVTIRRRIDVLASNGYIKFNKDPSFLKDPRSKYGMMCVENMQYLEREDVDEETGEITPHYVTILPTHFKEHEQGAILPVENPEVWVYA
jgi:putative DNA primase/helicase